MNSRQLHFLEFINLAMLTAPNCPNLSHFFAKINSSKFILILSEKLETVINCWCKTAYIHFKKARNIDHKFINYNSLCVLITFDYF